jgi:ABC-type transport system substrate-binding protein
MLATNWTSSSNYETWTFNLRQGVQFSDGNQFNAYTYWVTNYAAYYLEANSSTYWLGLSIMNTSAVDFGNATLAMIANSNMSNPSPQLLSIMQNSSWPVYVTGPYTVVFQLTVPFIWFPNTMAALWQWDPTYVMQHGGIGTPTTPNSYFDLNPAPGTGPYEVQKAVYQQYVLFQKNPYYWGDNLTTSQVSGNILLSPGYYNTVQVNNVPSDATRYVDLTTGKAQIAFLPNSELPIIQSNNAYGLVFFKAPAITESLDYNIYQYPLNITDVRLAIDHAINDSQIISEVLDGYGVQEVGPETPSYGVYYNPGNLQPYSFNDTLASQLLAQGGFPNGTNMPTLTFDVFTGNGNWAVTAGQLIAADLSAIGINTNVQVETSAQFFTPYGDFSTNVAAAQSGAIPDLGFSAGPTGYAPDYLAPIDYWVAFVSNESQWGNWIGYSNTQVNQYVIAAEYATNSSQAISDFAAANQIVYNQSPYDWIFAAQILGGTYAYNLNYVHTIGMDPFQTGSTDVPIFNTIAPS